jgi:beta-glucosidase
VIRRAVLRLLGGGSVSILAATSAKRAWAASQPLYKNARAPIAARVADLLGRMTLEEKVVQLSAIWQGKEKFLDGLEFNPAKASAAYPNGIGQITRPSDKRGVPGITGAAGGTAAKWREPAQVVDFVNAVQSWALNETRLGIPVLFHEESLHGYMATEATMFPQAIGMAGTFDPDLVQRVQSVVAREVRSRGITLVLSPVVDIVRDPRWGRIEETFGEDPYLVTRMGIAAVEGLQGAGKFERLATGKVFATLKHMTGHGQPESGNNIGPAQIGERELRENFFPPFREIVRRTSVGAVMPSYNEIDGVPSHANRWLLGDVLRGEWKFDGIVASDYSAVQELASLHHVAVDESVAARLALIAGVDCELPEGKTYATLPAQVRAGQVDVALIDRAVARILTFKMRAGLFENPYGSKTQTLALTGNAEARALALEAARKSLCLLTNDGTLPLDPKRPGRIVVIGPNHAIARLGGYSSVPKQTVSLIEGIRALHPAAEIVTAQGVFITTSEDRSQNKIELADPERNRQLIAEAVAVARSADTVILAIGDTEQTSREGFARDHLGDRSQIDIVGQQNELVDALAVLGKKLVVCAINGRPPSWPNVIAKANALIECWYPGQEGGTAMAEALFGRTNPGAKLPVSVVRNAGQIPLFYNRKPSSRRGYLFDDAAPLFPFGHGLSYTSFDVAVPRLSAAVIATDGSVSVETTVTNTGSRSGDEVVQLYLSRPGASVTQPVLRMRGFQRVTLAPGEARRVQFVLGPDDFAIWDAAMHEVVEPGRVIVSVGNSSAHLQSTELTIR